MPREASKRKGGDTNSSPGNNKRRKDAGNTSNKGGTGTSGGAKQYERQRKHADIVEEGKRLWNQLRLKNNTPEQNRKLMDELMPLITGKARQIALQHDASRVVQAALQFGTPKERVAILKELCVEEGSLVELCKSQYSHFVVIKALTYCHGDEEAVKLILKACKGHMAKLCVHAVASRVVQSMFTHLSAKKMAVLKQEFYGPHFALFAADLTQEKDFKVPTLASNLERAPDKTEVTLTFVRNIINKAMEKTLYGYSYVQDLMAEYIPCAPSAEVRLMAGQAADHVIHLLSTRAGTRVAADLIAFGTTKDRKRIMKSLKGYTRSGLFHRDAYLAIIRLVQVTDDTVSIQKNVLNELLTLPPSKDPNAPQDEPSSLLEVAVSETASKLLWLFLMEETDLRKRLDPYENSVLSANPTVLEDGKEVPTSKKDPSVRRQELLKHMKQPLIDLCTQHTEELLRSKPGSKVLREVYAAFSPPNLVDAVIAVCQKALDSEPAEDSMVRPLFEDAVAHLTLKQLILLDSKEESLGDATFASAFATKLESRLMEIARSNRGAFVVGALYKCPSLCKKVTSSLKAKELVKLSEGEGVTAGFEALLNDIINS